MSNVVLLAPFFALCIQAGVCDVRDFGAVGDGKRKNTKAFETAIAACSQRGGGVVFVPPGRYLIGAISLLSHITLEVGSGATVLGSEDPADYPLRDSVWNGQAKSLSSLIYAAGAEDITITGRDVIDGQGQIWWK